MYFEKKVFLFVCEVLSYYEQDEVRLFVNKVSLGVVMHLLQHNDWDEFNGDSSK